MPVISLWVKEGSLLCANWRLHIETVGGIWARGGCRQSLSLRPCDGTTVLPSGQARVGARKDSVHVERVCKCTGLKKKKEK